MGRRLRLPSVVLLDPTARQVDCQEALNVLTLYVPTLAGAYAMVHSPQALAEKRVLRPK